MTRICTGTTRCFVHSFTTGAALAVPKVRPVSEKDAQARASWLEKRGLYEQRDAYLDHWALTH